ncbi:hypothetical protein K1T71_008072 [Dendrolimus kikuchii]|uniref:Uncharacterized protein n=1 Tax=Dendrolimus kikuchii TaxID=765133 RepID=A0ACC1CW69_9NEOP|nr:hypothetical protein K1T71_008072 [Dendrolimus kikuchii]
MATARVTRLTDLGIEGGVKIKIARTGARMLVLPGADSTPKADALADSLRRVLNPEDVAVSRPEKTIGLRISGLDDCTTEKDVAIAIARATECSAEQIRPSKIRPGLDGLGATTKLLVGWASATVEALPRRPQRCYRCHEVGHVAAVCPSEVDRSGNCYRCGKDGHLVSGPCSAKPHCPLCEAAGRPAGHQLGSKPCGAKKPTRRNVQASRMAPGKAADAAVTATAAPSGQE